MNQNVITAQHIHRATGEQLARLYQVSERTVSKWAINGVTPRLKTLETATVLGVTVEVSLAGLKLRRKDALIAQRLREELESELRTPNSELRTPNSELRTPNSGES